MLRLNVLHNQYLWFMFAAAAVVLIGLVLSYVAIWRPRPQRALAEDQQEPTPLHVWIRFMPWIVAGVSIFTLIWSIIYLLLAAAQRPNI